jgi:hypothetical protein
MPSRNASAQDCIGFIVNAQPGQDQGVALRVAVQPDALTDDLLRCLQVDLLAEPVVKVLQDAGLQSGPGVARQQGRNVLLVHLGHRVGPGGLLYADQRQHFVAGRVLGAQEQTQVQPAHLHRLRVLARVLVLWFLRVEQPAAAGLAIRSGHVGLLEAVRRHRQEDRDSPGGQGGLQVHGRQRHLLGHAHQGAVAQTSPKRTDHQPMVAQGGAVEVD